MNNQKNLSRFGLDEETRLLLLDWCAANYAGAAIEVIAEALKEHIHGRMEREPEMRRRFDAARNRRAGSVKPKIVAIKGEA